MFETGRFRFRCVRDTYLGCGVSLDAGEVHHFRFPTREEAETYLKDKFGWGSEDMEVIEDTDIAAKTSSKHEGWKRRGNE